MAASGSRNELSNRLIAAAVAAFMPPSLALLLSLTTMVPAGAETDPPEQGSLTVGVVNPLVRVYPDTLLPVDGTLEVCIRALRGEYESAQLAVRSAVSTRLTAVASKLVHGVSGKSLPADSFRVRVVGYVPVVKNTPETPITELDRAAPAEFPDALLPQQQCELRPGRTQALWLTFHLPADAEPGTYRGRLDLHADSENLSIPVELQALPVTLPAERHLRVTNWISPNAIARFLGAPAWSEPVWEALPAYARNMAEHRQNVIFTPLELILPTRQPDGALTFDFARFDRWVQLFTDAGVSTLIEGSHLGKRKGAWTSPTFEFRPVKAMNDPLPPEPSETDVQALLTALSAHLKEKGWLDRYVQHVADEPTTYNDASWCELSAKVHTWAPELRRIDALHSPNLTGQLEIWIPQLDVLDQNRLRFEAERDQRGAELWFYTCMYPRGLYANRFIDSPLTETRALPWLALRLGCSGILHWGYNFWSEAPFQNVERSNLPPGDSFIVYPGKDGPIDSIRWETLRDGIEDCEMLRLLQHHGNPNAAQMFLTRLTPTPQTTSQDPTLWTQGREALLAEVRRTVAPPYSPRD